MPESSAARYGQAPDTQTTIVQRAWPMPPGQDTGPRISAAADTGPVLDVRRLRNPSEPSRFALAASASILVVGTGFLVTLRLAGVLAIGSLAAFLLMVFGLVWWVQQVRRAKLLGGTARVTPETFPVLSAAAENVKRQVGYARPVEIFVAAHASQPVLLTSFFGTRILLMDGDLAADLLKPGNRPQLDFILATYLGALKVKALAWEPLHIAIDALGLPHVLNFFIAPWERATVYTGDQVAATCGAAPPGQPGPLTAGRPAGAGGPVPADPPAAMGRGVLGDAGDSAGLAPPASRAPVELHRLPGRRPDPRAQRLLVPATVDPDSQVDR